MAPPVNNVDTNFSVLNKFNRIRQGIPGQAEPNAPPSGPPPDAAFKVQISREAQDLQTRFERDSRDTDREHTREQERLESEFNREKRQIETNYSQDKLRLRLKSLQLTDQLPPPII